MLLPHGRESKGGWWVGDFRLLPTNFSCLCYSHILRLFWWNCFCFWVLLLWSKQKPESGGGSKGRGETTKQAADDLPRTSHPPASLRCTGRSHCKGSVLDLCSFFPFCSPSSDHRCTLVCKAHSDKIPARSRARRCSDLGAKGLWRCLFVHGLDDTRTKWASRLPLLCVCLITLCEYWGRHEQTRSHSQTQRHERTEPKAEEGWLGSCLVLPAPLWRVRWKGVKIWMKSWEVER